MRRHDDLADRGFTVRELAAAPRPPPTRGDCATLPRPCPALRCRWHLGAESEFRGYSCALDLADRGGMTMEAVADVLAVSKARVGQLEAEALVKVRFRIAADE